MGGVATAFSTALNIWKQTQARTDLAQEARGILSLLSRDLQMAYVGNNDSQGIFVYEESNLTDSYCLRFTTHSGAEFTVSAIRQPIGLAAEFGVIQAADDDPTRITDFLEKPQNPIGLADSPGEVLASMGNYVADADALIAAVTADSEDPTSKHDMGGDIVPYFVNRGTAAVYDFIRNDVAGSTDRDRDYWRDVGTIDAYYELKSIML